MGDPPRMYRTIRSTDKMCLAFKILAASRLCDNQEQVAKAFNEAFQNIKSTDAVVVGMFPEHEDQINLNIQYTIDACGKGSQGHTWNPGSAETPLFPEMGMG